MELDSKLQMSSVRVKVWHCLQDKDILGRMVKDRSKAIVQVVDMRVLGWGGLSHPFGLTWTHMPTNTRLSESSTRCTWTSGNQRTGLLLFLEGMENSFLYPPRTTFSYIKLNHPRASVISSGTVVFIVSNMCRPHIETEFISKWIVL